MQQAKQENSQGGFMSPNAFGTPGETQKRTTQNLRPVSIKQILDSISTMPDSPLMVDNQDLHQISIIGRINSTVISSSNIQYVIDDGTGQIDVRKFNDIQDDEQQNSFSEGQFVKIIGQPKVFNTKKSINAFKISLVESLDEIANHNLKIVYTHLMITRPEKFIKNPTQNGLQSAFGQGSNFNNDLTPLQNQIMNVLRQYTGDFTGCPLSDIVHKLRSLGSEDQIR
jgi:RecG-like helicase